MRHQFQLKTALTTAALTTAFVLISSQTTMAGCGSSVHSNQGTTWQKKNTPVQTVARKWDSAALTPPPFPRKSVDAPPPLPVTVAWHVALNDRPSPKLTLKQVHQYIQSGHVEASTLAWKTGLSKWVPAGTIPELAACFPKKVTRLPEPATTDCSYKWVTGYVYEIRAEKITVQSDDYGRCAKPVTKTVYKRVRVPVRRLVKVSH